MRSVKRISILLVTVAGASKRWMWLGLGASLIVVGGMGASPGPTAECPPVHIAVILDGVRYEPGEFNDLHSELCGKVDLIFTDNPENGDLLAFTTVERFNEWAAKHGLPPLNPDFRAAEGQMGPVLTTDGDIYACAPTDSLADCESRVDREEAATSDAEPLQACPPPSSYWSRNWEHINCAGSSLSVAPKVSIADLRNVGGYNWNDRISSVQAATGIFYESLFEHINFKGDVFIARVGYTFQI